MEGNELMKKLVIYSVCGIMLLGLLYYLLGQEGLIAGLFGLGGYGGNKAMRKLREEGEALDKQAKDKTEELRKIEEERKNLKVEDLTPEEEKEYWKDV
jgi:hypothetical protein